MAVEIITARYKKVDEEGNAVMDDEGKVVYEEAQANYDFGDKLEDLSEKCGGEVVFSNAIANMKVTLQSRIRALHKAGLTLEAIQEQVTAWVPGMVSPKVAVDPIANTISQFSTWSPEKQKEFLKKLQGK